VSCSSPGGMIVAVCLLMGMTAVAADTDTRDGDAILRGVWLRFPHETVTLTGTLSVRTRRGTVEKMVPFELLMDGAGNPAQAVYTIRDTDGRITERMTVVRRGEEPPVYQFSRGDPPRDEPVPDLNLAVDGSDITWMDLTLSFLWWRGSEVLGKADIKGRPCHWLSVKTPDSLSGQYSRVELWIDHETGMLLQAEAFDAGGDRVRRLWIKSFRKIRDRWMIKDMEIESYPRLRRTRLRIDDLAVQPQPDQPNE